MLTISIDSQFEFGINIDKVLKMLVIHDLEECIIGDITPFDVNVTTPSVQNTFEVIFKDLIKKDEYIELRVEFEENKTKDTIFAYICDKLNNDIQIKIYEYAGYNYESDPYFSEALYSINKKNLKKVAKCYFF